MPSKKIEVRPWLGFTADVSVANDRNATVAHVSLFSAEDDYEEVGFSSGSSKREQGDNYSESVAVGLAVGRALQKMGRSMVSAANKEVRAAMAEAEARAAEKAEAAYRALPGLGDEAQADADEKFISDLMAILGLGSSSDTMPPLSFGFDAEDRATPFLDALLAETGPLADVQAESLAEALKGENLTADGEPTTADGTPVSQLPIDLRATLASLGFRPHQVTIVGLDELDKLV